MPNELKRKISALENRMEYLGKKLDQLNFSEGSKQYIRAEYFALEWAIPILKEKWKFKK